MSQSIKWKFKFRPVDQSKSKKTFIKQSKLSGITSNCCDELHCLFRLSRITASVGKQCLISLVTVVNVRSASTGSSLSLQINIYTPCAFTLSGYMAVYSDTAYVQPFYNFLDQNTTKPCWFYNHLSHFTPSRQ